MLFQDIIYGRLTGFNSRRQRYWAGMALSVGSRLLWIWNGANFLNEFYSLCFCLSLCKGWLSFSLQQWICFVFSGGWNCEEKKKKRELLMFVCLYIMEYNKMFFTSFVLSVFFTVTYTYFMAVTCTFFFAGSNCKRHHALMLSLFRFTSTVSQFAGFFKWTF